MLRDLHRQGVHSHHQAKEFIGEKFESRIHSIIGDWNTSAKCCEYLLELVNNTFLVNATFFPTSIFCFACRRSVAVQCDTPMEKFNFLVFAMQKLYCGVQDVSCPESPDHVMTQEVLLGGHLYLQIIKDKLINWLESIKHSVIKKSRDATFTMQPSNFAKYCSTLLNGLVKYYDVLKCRM